MTIKCDYCGELFTYLRAYNNKHICKDCFKKEENMKSNFSKEKIKEIYLAGIAAGSLGMTQNEPRFDLMFEKIYNDFIKKEEEKDLDFLRRYHELAMRNRFKEVHGKKVEGHAVFRENLKNESYIFPEKREDTKKILLVSKKSLEKIYHNEKLICHRCISYKQKLDDYCSLCLLDGLRCFRNKNERS